MRRALLVIALGMVVAAPSRGLDCSLVTNNLVPNCGFDAGVAGWSVPVGGGLQASGGGQNGVGARFNGDQAGDGVLWSPCIAAQPGMELALSIAVTNDGPASAPSCQIGVQEFSDAACATPLPFVADSAPELVADSTFHTLSATHVVGPGAQSMALALSCEQPGVGFEARVDDGVLALASPVPMSPLGLAILAASLALAAFTVLRSSR